MKKALVIIIICLLMASNIAFITHVTASSADKIPVVIGFKNHMNTNAVTALVGNVNREYSIINAVSVSLPQQAIDALKKNPNVAYIDNDITFMATDPAPDAELTNSWGVYHIGAGTVQASGNTGYGINVAVIDTGINYNHEDLINRYKGGWNFVANNADPNDDNGHGTHCAGIIAATDNNDAVVGVAPQANIYALKALDRTGTGSLSNIVAAILWATNTRTDLIPDNDIQVISMSLGSSTGASSLQAACDAAYGAGILLVAASGNNGASSVSYPASYPSVIAVGATDSSDNRASFSSYGNKLELVAPGVNIISDYIDVSPNDGRNHDTLYMSGTSMACPHVAGVAALVFASPIDPAFDSIVNGVKGVWDASEVRNKLDSTAKNLGTAGRDVYYGYGLVDAIQATPATPVDTTPPSISGLTPPNGASLTISNPTISATAIDPSGIDKITMTLDGNPVTPTITPIYSGDTIAYTPTTLAVGSHIVILSVSDAKGNIAATPTTWTFTVNTPKTMHVQSITMQTVTTIMQNTYAKATITIVDSNDKPLKGAIVTGQWSGATNDRDTATTSSSGTVILQSDNVRRAPTGTTYTITVTSVQLNGYTFTSGTDTNSIQSK